MEMYVKNIIPLMEAKYNSFTDIEKNIADYFIKNNDISELSSKVIASKLFVSEASLSRFAKKCGFSGYREFVYVYKESFDERKNDSSSLSKTVLDTYSTLLSKTRSLIDEIQISRIVKLLKKSTRVVACGKGSSGLVAEEMESRFMRIGIDIDSVKDTDRMRMQSVFLNDKSLVFGFSLSGTTEAVLYLLREAHLKKAKTVLFTANINQEFSKYCDEVILVASTKFLHYGNILSPQFPLLVALDVIYSELVNLDRTLKAALHDYTVKALGKEDIMKI